MSYSARLQKLQSQLDSLSVDGFLVSDETNVRYLTGFTGDSTFVWVRRDQITMLSDGRYQTQLADECEGIEVAIRPPSVLLHDLVLDVVGGSDTKRIGVEASAMSLADFQQLETAFRKTGKEIEFSKTTGVIEAHREIKDEGELNLIRQAIGVAEVAFDNVRKTLSKNQSELDVARELEWAMRDDGAQGVSFDIIVAFGEMGALPHYSPTNRTLGNQSTVLIDWGAVVHGYASDISRTLHRVKPDGTRLASDHFCRGYEAVLESQMAAIDALKPGVTGREIDQVARDVLVRHGLEDAFLHSLGHGIGLQVHEGPRLAAAGQKTLEAGMVVTVEPGIYFAGDFGIRIEDDVLITPQGAEVLTSLPKGLDDCRLML